MNHYFLRGCRRRWCQPLPAGSLFLKAGFFCNRLGFFSLLRPCCLPDEERGRRQWDLTGGRRALFRPGGVHGHDLVEDKERARCPLLKPESRSMLARRARPPRQHDYEDALHFVEGLMRWTDKTLRSNPLHNFPSHTRFSKDPSECLWESWPPPATDRYPTMPRRLAYSTGMISTRRFNARPAAVALGLADSLSPLDSRRIRPASIPFDII